MFNPRPCSRSPPTPRSARTWEKEVPPPQTQVRPSCNPPPHLSLYLMRHTPPPLNAPMHGPPGQIHFQRSKLHAWVNFETLKHLFTQRGCLFCTLHYCYVKVCRLYHKYLSSNLSRCYPLLKPLGCLSPHLNPLQRPSWGQQHLLISPL